MEEKAPKTKGKKESRGLFDIAMAIAGGLGYADKLNDLENLWVRFKVIIIVGPIFFCIGGCCCYLTLAISALGGG